VPGPQFGDPKRQEGSGVIALGTPAVPPAADCGTAPPCGGRLYGGPARGLTFGLLPNKWIKRSPIRHQGCMERNAPPITFFTERSLAAYLAVSDRTSATGSGEASCPPTSSEPPAGSTRPT
jgi:hypothetical protein